MTEKAGVEKNHSVAFVVCFCFTYRFFSVIVFYLLLHTEICIKLFLKFERPVTTEQRKWCKTPRAVTLVRHSVIIPISNKLCTIKTPISSASCCCCCCCFGLRALRSPLGYMLLLLVWSTCIAKPIGIYVVVVVLVYVHCGAHWDICCCCCCFFGLRALPGPLGYIFSATSQQWKWKCFI